MLLLVLAPVSGCLLSNSNQETIHLHQSLTCLPSLQWMLNPPSPFTGPFLSCGGQSQQTFTCQHVFSKNLNSFRCPLDVPFWFYKWFCWTKEKWSMCIVMKLDFVPWNSEITLTDLPCTFISIFYCLSSLPFGSLARWFSWKSLCYGNKFLVRNTELIFWTQTNVILIV